MSNDQPHEWSEGYGTQSTGTHRLAEQPQPGSSSIVAYPGAGQSESNGGPSQTHDDGAIRAATTHLITATTSAVQPLPAVQPAPPSDNSSPEGGPSSIDSESLQTHIGHLARKRTLSASAATGRAVKKIRKPRSCPKCGREEGCNGRQRASRCEYSCRDCGQKACRGRNSKRPGKPCWDAKWDE